MAKVLSVKRTMLVRRVQSVHVTVPDDYNPAEQEFDEFDALLCDKGYFDLAAEYYEGVDNDELDHERIVATKVTDHT